MYNMLFGYDPNAGILLSMLGLDQDSFGRFRDAYLSKDKKKIIVYTRCGGGNREDYQGVFDKMREHPLYLCDYDDNYDCTYASIEFKVPKEYEDTVNSLESGLTGEEKFKQFIDMLEKEEE